MRILQAWIFITATTTAACVQSADRAETTCYDPSPKLAIMTGFICEPLRTRREGGRVTFTVRPDPVASVVFR